jgi:predicted HAD superfamily Cof-like phosphohydrolase
MADNSTPTTNFNKVGEFHDTFEHPKHDVPQMDVFTSKPDLVKLRIALIEEELNELKEACDNHDMTEVADALCDILYVTYGAGHAFGLDLDTLFNEVQRSNMTKSCDNEEDAKLSVQKIKETQERYKDPQYKLSKTGKHYVVYDKATGKILKNHKYSPPNLKDMVDAKVVEKSA